MNREPALTGHDNFKPLKHSRRIVAWPKSQLHCSGIGVIPSGTIGVIVVIRGRSGVVGVILTPRFNPILPIIAHSVGVFLSLPA